MKHLALLLAVLASSAFAESPACLSGPVTKGNVTVSCSMIDTTGGIAAADLGIFADSIPSYLLVVRVSSVEPDVASFRITAKYIDLDTDARSSRVSVVFRPADTPAQEAGFVGTYVFSFRDTRYPKLTDITVEELKPSSTQAF